MVVSIGGSEKEYEEMGVKVRDCLTSYSTTAYALGMKEEEPFLLYGIDSIKYSEEELDTIVLDINKSVLG